MLQIKLKPAMKNDKANGNKKESTSAHVTTDQLLNVKLKRVSFHKQGKDMSKENTGIVTLRDLQSIKLRRTPSGKASKNDENSTPLKNISNNFGARNVIERIGNSVEKRYVLFACVIIMGGLVKQNLVSHRPSDMLVSDHRRRGKEKD